MTELSWNLTGKAGFAVHLICCACGVRDGRSRQRVLYVWYVNLLLRRICLPPPLQSGMHSIYTLEEVAKQQHPWDGEFSRSPRLHLATRRMYVVGLVGWNARCKRMVSETRSRKK
jgi:hypothetical protein